MPALPTEFACETNGPTCLVLDLGSGTLKAGFSNQDLPVLEMPSLVGLVDQEKGPLFGIDALDASQLLKPIQRGRLKEPEALESLLSHVINTKLGIPELKQPVLCIVSPVLPLASRTRLVEILFEKFKAPAVALLSSAVSALFSTGETSGLVVEVGDGISTAVPVFEGFAVPHASFSSDVAGADVTAALRSGLEHKLKLKLGLVSANTIKEKFAFVSVSDSENHPKVHFELPDGTVVAIPQESRWECTEQLFQGERSVQQLALKALNALDADLQLELVKNVVVSGGSTSLGNFGTRLRQELVSVLRPELAKELKVTADIHRRRGAWIGGSMFGSLSTFARHTITKQEFDEHRTELPPLVAHKMI